MNSTFFFHIHFTARTQFVDKIIYTMRDRDKDKILRGDYL